MAKKRVPNVQRGGQAIPIGGNLFYMDGRTHEQGGIDIGDSLEIEGGEIMQLLPNEVRVFSAQPILNGYSPSQLVMGGANPNAVFNAQEKFKQVNRINDDGTRKKNGGQVKARLGFWDDLDGYADKAEIALAAVDAGLTAAGVVSANPILLGAGYATSLAGGAVDVYQGVRSAIKGDYPNVAKNAMELGLSLIGAKFIKAAKEANNLDKALDAAGATRQYVKKTYTPRKKSKYNQGHTFNVTKEHNDAMNYGVKGANTVLANTLSNTVISLDDENNNDDESKYRKGGVKPLFTLGGVRPSKKNKKAAVGTKENDDNNNYTAVQDNTYVQRPVIPERIEAYTPEPAADNNPYGRNSAYAENWRVSDEFEKNGLLQWSSNVMHDRVKADERYVIPYIPEKEIRLTTGRYNTGRISTNLLDSIYDAAVRTGTPLSTALGLAGRESTLGIGRGFKRGQGIAATEMMSNWQQVNPALRTNKKENELRREYRRLLSKYNALEEPLTAEEADRMIEIMRDERERVNNLKTLDENPIDNALRYFNSGNYNRGDSRHTRMVEEDGQILLSDPAIQKWLNSKNITAQDMKTNRKRNGGAVSINGNVVNRLMFAPTGNRKKAPMGTDDRNVRDVKDLKIEVNPRGFTWAPQQGIIDFWGFKENAPDYIQDKLIEIRDSDGTIYYGTPTSAFNSLTDGQLNHYMRVLNPYNDNDISLSINEPKAERIRQRRSAIINGRTFNDESNAIFARSISSSTDNPNNPSNLRQNTSVPTPYYWDDSQYAINRQSINRGLTNRALRGSLSDNGGYDPIEEGILQVRELGTGNSGTPEGFEWSDYTDAAATNPNLAYMSDSAINRMRQWGFSPAQIGWLRGSTVVNPDGTITTSNEIPVINPQSTTAVTTSSTATPSTGRRAGTSSTPRVARNLANELRSMLTAQTAENIASENPNQELLNYELGRMVAPQRDNNVTAERAINPITQAQEIQGTQGTQAQPQQSGTLSYPLASTEDWIGLGSNIAGSMANYLISRNTPRVTLTEPYQPVMETPVRMVTRYNARPQISNIEENTRSTYRNIRGNTGSSRVALQRMQRARNEASQQIGNVLAYKENQETKLKNQDAANRQSVRQRNAKTYNDYLTNLANVRSQQAMMDNAADVADMQARLSLVNNMNTSLQDFLKNIRQNRNFNNSLALLRASNPDVSDQLLQAAGVNLQANILRNLFGRTNG